MDYLTLEEVLLMHARLIQRTGGSGGVRDMGPLESALARPQATFEGRDLHISRVSRKLPPTIQKTARRKLLYLEVHYGRKVTTCTSWGSAA